MNDTKTQNTRLRIFHMKTLHSDSDVNLFNSCSKRGLNRFTLSENEFTQQFHSVCVEGFYCERQDRKQWIWWLKEVIKFPALVWTAEPLCS